MTLKLEWVKELLKMKNCKKLLIEYGKSSKSKTFRSEDLYEQAIDEMKKSIAENRGDGKASPKVGAVLVSAAGDILGTAHRGELREGDHAEFTLLDRKFRERSVTGSFLFATLEPCAPKSRNPPKLGCAERIVNARIAKIWIGIEDPDPTVDRKGIKYLQDAGIEVEMFDPEFQNIIYAENKDFLDQAMERAAEVKKPKPIELSPLEKPVATADLSELSDEALAIYSTRSGMNLPIDAPEFLAHLQQRQLIELDAANILRPTGLGILLFGKNPRNRYPQAVLKVQARYGNAEPEIHDFADALVLLPEQVESWLKKVLTSTISREAFAREVIYDYPITVLREAIINAIVHRDYDIEGAKIYLNIDDEKIVVKSPGLPVKPIKLEDFQQFKAPSLSRNPKLMAVFNAMNLVEERGMGMDEMKSLPDTYHLPRPSVTWEDPYLVITFPRSKAFMGNIIQNEILSQLNDEERTGLFYIRDKQTISKPDYAHKFYFNDKKAQRHLSKFVDLGLVKATGNGPSRRFSYIENR